MKKRQQIVQQSEIELKRKMIYYIIFRVLSIETPNRHYDYPGVSITDIMRARYDGHAFYYLRLEEDRSTVEECIKNLQRENIIREIKIAVVGTGFLIGFALKRIMKILAVVAGVFFAALMYLESQHIVNINWDKLQTISNSILSTITTTTTNATSTTGRGVGPIQAFLGNNSTAQDRHNIFTIFT